MRNIFIIGFVLMAAAQWYAPLSMIFESENTIEGGTEYKFKTRPVDPTDPFRGKYITLDYEAETYEPKDTMELYVADRPEIYGVIGTDSAGFARIEKVVIAPPTDRDWIPLKLSYVSGRTSAVFEFPFDRFYLEESKASEAEQVYWQSRRDSVVVYAKVMILDGDAKLVDVIVNDSSIADVVSRINANKED
jgi:uncharacterized membrane-anchored protein